MLLRYHCVHKAIVLCKRVQDNARNVKRTQENTREGKRNHDDTGRGKNAREHNQENQENTRMYEEQFIKMQRETRKLSEVFILEYPPAVRYCGIVDTKVLHHMCQRPTDRPGLHCD